MWLYTAIPANGIAKVSVCEEHHLGFFFFIYLSKMKKMVTLMEIVEEIKRIAIRMKMIR